MHKFSLFLLLTSSIALNGMELAVQAPRSLGDLKVIAADDGFYVQKGDFLTRVQNHDVDQVLKDARKARAMKALKNSYVSVSQYSNGDYKLKLNGRLNGGGPILGAIVYYGVKAVGYGVPVVLATTAASTVVAATAGTATPLVGSALGGVAGALTTTVGAAGTTAAGTLMAGTTAATTIGAVTAAGTAATVVTTVSTGGAAIAAGSVVVGTVGTAAAEAGVVATVAASGGVAGYIATVESTAAFLGTAATFIPWL